MAFKDRFSIDEIKYLGLVFLAAVVLVAITNTDKAVNYITSLNPVLQFVLLNIMIYIVFFYFFKFIASNHKAWEGSLGSIMVWLGLDIIIPEYHVTLNGLIPGGLFGKASSDYFFGYIYSSNFAIGGLALVALVYIITPVVLLAIGAYLMKDFVKNI